MHGRAVPRRRDRQAHVCGHVRPDSCSGTRQSAERLRMHARVRRSHHAFPCPMVPTKVVTCREVYDRGTLWQRSILRKGGVPITCLCVRWFRTWSHAAKLRWATSREGGQTCAGARPHHAIPSPVAPTMVTCREASLRHHCAEDVHAREEGI